MKKPAITRTSILYALTLISVGSVGADDVTILSASFQQQAQHQDGTQWSVSVTLKHNDTGWDHYADEWRIVDIEGRIYGNRVLLHPHINEQPFSRSANGIIVPDDVSIVYIEAHGKIDGWMKNRLEINLVEAHDGHLKISNE